MTKADVTHHPGNAQHTGTGLKKLDDWLGDEEWDVIHFNWGLWDLCYRHPDAKTTGKRDKVRGTLTTPIEQYEEQLERIVERLKKTDAKLVWASTTPVPENEPGRFAGDAEKYNRVAAQIMQKHEIIINDLHRFAATRLDEIQKPSDVHFTEEGSRSLASQVSKVILQQLETGCSASVTEEKRR